MRGDRCNLDAYQEGTSRLQGGASAAPPRSGYYAPGDFDSSDSEPWFRPPSRDSYLGLDSLRRPARSRAGWGDDSDEQSGESVSHRPPSRVAHRRSGNRSRGQGDQVASHSARRGKVIVVETSEDSACQSAYYSARESRSGSPVESRRRSMRHGAQGSGVSSSEGGGRLSSHRSQGGRVGSSGEGRRHLEHYSDPGEGGEVFHTL